MTVPRIGYDNLDRLPPQNIEAEQSLLGAIILDPSILREVELEPEDFYKGGHVKIFKAILDMAAIKEPIDLITLSEHLRSCGAIEDIGGASYLSQLLNLAGISSNHKAYAGIIKDKATRRKYILSAYDIIRKSYDEEESVEEIKQVYRAEFKAKRSKIMSARDVAGITIEYVDRVLTQGIPGIPSGFIDLDDLLKGFIPGNLYTIGGRPGSGKTALAFNCALNIAVNTGVPQGVFELEMSDEQMGVRATSDIGDIHQDHLASKANYINFLNAAEKFATLPIHFHFQSNMNLNMIVNGIDEMVCDKGVKLIWIDYLQLVKHIIENRNREAEVSAISGTLKSCAKEYRVPIVVLAQLNRDCEKRPNKRPMLSDLRESGSLEQDSDAVIFIYRDEMYNVKTKDKGIAEIIAAKNRHGRTGRVKLTWDPTRTKFKNLAYGEEGLYG